LSVVSDSTDPSDDDDNENVRRRQSVEWSLADDAGVDELKQWNKLHRMGAESMESLVMMSMDNGSSVSGERRH